MCREVQCSKCKKPSWAGCGAHVESVLAHVPVAQRCACRAKDASTSAEPSGIARTIRRLFGG